MSGSLSFKANDKFSYYITMQANLDGTNIRTQNSINLHDQVYISIYYAVHNSFFFGFCQYFRFFSVFDYFFRS